MKKMFSAILVAGGLVLMITGINMTNILQSNEQWTLTGKPTNKARVMLFGGAAVALIGLRWTLKKP